MSRARGSVALAVIAVVLVSPFLSGCVGIEKPTPAAGAIAPFAIDQDFADPGVLVVGKRVYVYATNSLARNVQLATTDDMNHWTVSDSDVLPELPAWAERGKTWAPAAMQVAPGRYALYFTASDSASGFQCIGVATASSPAGPFASAGTSPLVCPVADGGAIDPSTIRTKDGTRYLVWKNDGNCCGLDTWIWIQALSEDGLTLQGSPIKLIKQTQPWEGHLVEAPVIVEHAGEFVLLYSANDYATDKYAVGMAASPNLLGPYKKSASPLLSTSSSREKYLGPGGADLVTFRGHDWMLFHSWDDNYIYRGLHAEPVSWIDGAPRLSGKSSSR